MGDESSKKRFFSPAFPSLERFRGGLKGRPAPPVVVHPADAGLDLPFPEPDEVTPPPTPPDETEPDPAAPPDKHFNYVHYFSEIEAAFAAHRGKPYRLSPLDWALIEGWRKEGVPLAVVIRAIAQTFAVRAEAFARQPKGRPRPVRSLAYCRSAVEEAFRDYRAGRVGETPAAAVETGGLPPAKVIAFLETAAQAVQTAQRTLPEAHVRPEAPHPRLKELLPTVVAQLEALHRRMRSEAPLPLEALETALSELEDALLAALRSDAPAEVLAAAEAEAAAALKPHRKGMAAAAYAQARANYVTQWLRRRYGVPPLSLFYIEDV